eukprot:SAG25_NODE_448_length_7916_cov_6.846105_6_plen_66_part_00
MWYLYMYSFIGSIEDANRVAATQSHLGGPAAGGRTAKTYGSAACLHGLILGEDLSQLISVCEIDL